VGPGIVDAVREPTFVVLGGGPAGGAAAIALRQSGGGTVVLAESGTYEIDRIGESVPPDIRRLFTRLGLLEAFEREDHQRCYGSCSSWGDEVLGHNDFTVNPNGTGFHLDRRRFDAYTWSRAHGSDRCGHTRTRPASRHSSSSSTPLVVSAG
jgi:2-polyprenyl-6-methoxyphenol hydroxylase-like FAD-dependent oxidoreductase